MWNGRSNRSAALLLRAVLLFWAVFARELHGLIG
jgi:hypothetical protein